MVGTCISAHLCMRLCIQYICECAHVYVVVYMGVCECACVVVWVLVYVCMIVYMDMCVHVYDFVYGCV